MQRPLVIGVFASGLLFSLGACSFSTNSGAADAVGPYIWSDSDAAPVYVYSEEEEVDFAAELEEIGYTAPRERIDVDLGPSAGLSGTGAEPEPGPLGAAADPGADQAVAAPNSTLTTSCGLPLEVGPEAPEEWKVIPPKKTWGDSLAVQRPTEGLRLVDTILQASPRTGMIFYERQGPFEDVVIENSIVRVEPGTLPLDRSYWGLRGYDMIDMVLRRVEITGFGKVTPKHDEGHAVYVNLRGSLTVEGCDIHHNGGQGLQIVNRPAESNFPPGPAEGEITIRRTRFLENGFNPDRGGFQVSIFGTGQNVRIQDVLITAGFDGTEFPDAQTGGGLLIEAEAYNEWRKKPVWWRPDELPEDFEIPFTQGEVELVNLSVQHENANRPIVQIKGCEALYVRECNFGPGRIDLDSPNKQGRDCGKIVWQGNSGPAIVYVRGERMGRADEDFVIKD